MSDLSELPIGAVLKQLGGIQQFINLLSKHPGFEDLSASTVSRWSQKTFDDLPPRARQALDVIERYSSPNRPIQTAIANGLWSLLPMLLEAPEHVGNGEFQLSPSTAKALDGLTINVEDMPNGQEVIDSLVHGRIQIGFVSERYKSIVETSYAAELSLVAEVCRGTPLGIARHTVIERYRRSSDIEAGASRFGFDVLSGQRITTLAKTMGPVITSDFELNLGLLRPPDMVAAYSIEQMIELLVEDRADIALSYEPVITEVLTEANNRARARSSKQEEMVPKFERLPDFTLLDKPVKFYMVCNSQMRFDLFIRYLKSLQIECRHLNTFLRNRDTNTVSRSAAYEGDPTISSLATRIANHFGMISDPSVRAESLARALRTTRFEITDVNLDGIIRLYECEDTPQRV